MSKKEAFDFKKFLRQQWAELEPHKLLGRDRLKLKIKVPYINKTICNKTIYLDPEIPNTILDVFDNLGYINKDGKKPVIVAKNLKDDGTWHLVITLPPAIPFSKVRSDHEKGCFSDAVRKHVEIKWESYLLHMTIHNSKGLPELIPYRWDQTLYEHMELAIPVGYSYDNTLIAFDLAESPHMLIAGQTGFGKTMAIHCILNALLSLPREIQICICDPKRIDFRYLGKQILLARDDEEICNLLKAINRESDKRLKQIEKADLSVTKIQELDNPPPYIIVVIDEMAQLSDEAMDYIWRIGSLSRAAGVHLITATQFPYADIIPSKLRNLLEARLCFKVPSEASSRVVLGDEGPMAAWLPTERSNGEILKGRAIWKFGHVCREVQTMLLTKNARKTISQNGKARRWEFEQCQTKKLLPSRARQVNYSDY
jgi:hypothetical protein